ncbi:MAG: 30S ribosomal protein S18 [Candidatus Portnoybacteria bacterium]|nr:30S ribosomal protein S18 [Candidatus Portnoybacteria bacterium]
MKKVCYMCQKNIRQVDFKNVELLRHFLTMQAKISSAKRSGNCRKHQKELSRAIKKARYMALLPYTAR